MENFVILAGFNNMLDFPISPLLGAIVFSERSWKKIPREYRQSFIDITNRKIVSMDKASRELNDKALKVMLDNGLTVNSVDEEQKDAWLKVVNTLYAQQGIIGSLVSRDIYNEIISYIDEYRANSGKDEN